MRWLNIGGGAQKGPAIFYDEEAPFQGHRRSANFRVGLQPNSRINSNTSYSFVTFNNRSTGEHVYDVHIVNLRNTYQFSSRFFVRAVAQFDSSRERVLTDFLASYELSPGTVVHAGYGSLFGKEHEELRLRTLSGDGARVFFQGVLPGPLLMAATSLPARLPSRRYEWNNSGWSNVQSADT